MDLARVQPAERTLRVVENTRMSQQVQARRNSLGPYENDLSAAIKRTAHLDSGARSSILSARAPEAPGARDVTALQDSLASQPRREPPLPRPNLIPLTVLRPFSTLEAPTHLSYTLRALNSPRPLTLALCRVESS
jgi:hypothetical protein